MPMGPSTGWMPISRKILLLMLLCAIVPCTLYTQTKIDSLEAALTSAKGDMAISLYKQLVNSYLRNGDQAKAITAAAKASDLAKRQYSSSRQAGLYSSLAKYFRTGRMYDQANQYIDRTISILRPVQDSSLVHALMTKGRIQHDAARFKNALSFLLEAESLGSKLENAQTRCRILTLIGVTYLRLSDYSASIKSLKRSLNISRVHGYSDYSATSLMNMGACYIQLNKLDSALVYLNQAQDLYDELDQKATSLSISNNIGAIYQRQEQYDKAIETYEQSLVAADELGAAETKAIALLGIGGSKQEKGDLEGALTYLLESLAIADSLGNRHLGTFILNKLGKISERLGNISKAMDYYQECLDLREEMGNKRGVAGACQSIAVTYYNQEDYKQAERYFERAMRINREIDNSLGIIDALPLLAITRIKLGELASAREMANEALALARKTKNKRGEQEAQAALGALESEIQHFKDAAVHYRKGLVIAHDLGRQDDRERLLQDLTQVYIRLNDADSATATFTQYLALRDSLLNDRVTRQLTELETKYKTREQKKEIQLLQRQKEVQQLHYRSVQDSLKVAEKSKKLAIIEAALDKEKHERDVESVKQQALMNRKYDQQKIQLLVKDQQINEAELKSNEAELVSSQRLTFAILAGLAFALVLAVALFIAYRQNKRANEVLRNTQEQLLVQEKLASLGQLTAGIAHEIQNPLNFVNNFSEITSELAEEGLNNIVSNTTLSAAERNAELNALMVNIKNNSSRVQEHGKRASNIVKQMLSHSRSSSGELVDMELNGLLGDVVDLAYHGRKAQGSLAVLALNKVFANEPIMVSADPQELSQVFVNILNNAFDAVTERHNKDTEAYSPSVTVRTEHRHKQAVIYVRDNGVGISKDVQEKIFKPFFTTKAIGKGTGLGLSIAHDVICKKLGGDIKIHSRKGEFTEFIVTLPAL
jgi:two-component system, NtrC family, sensor kinase